jgi:hypothetical protein
METNNKLTNVHIYCIFWTLCSHIFPLSYALFYTFISEHVCIPLQCFYKGGMQSNQQMALSCLMHIIHCSITIFPYHAFESRLAQETAISCAGLHSIRNS